ncbi:MAG: class I SAM-dependent methyltransferase [Nanoarchaeota archaeon]|nr:class I SAM-dependent methyltransferase [Nanoarchaeota archaeon]
MGKEEKVGGKVEKFYNRTPFPDYDLTRFKTRDDLRSAAYPFARYLDRIIPKTASILDIGCGTGQLVGYLSLERKKVHGYDFSEGSLSKARQLKENLKLDSLTLDNLDILNPPKSKEQFDYVFCNGVLHHTANPFKGFCNVARYTKKGGFLVVGLYHRVGRQTLYTKRFLMRTLFRGNKRVLKAFIKPQISTFEDKERLRGWFNDQYKHPHESTHTVGQVLRWFRANDIEFVSSVPRISLTDEIDTSFESIFFRDPSVKPRLNWLPQLKWLWTIRNEGGYFLMVGRK